MKTKGEPIREILRAGIDHGIYISARPELIGALTMQIEQTTFLEGTERVRVKRAWKPRPDGATFDPAKDGPRLGTLHNAVFALMSDGCWRTLGEIQAGIADEFDVKGSEAGISARLRDFRKRKFGGFEVKRRRRIAEAGLWEYRLQIGGKDMT